MSADVPGWGSPLTVAPGGERPDGGWWWSERLFGLLGLAPGEITATADALVAHVLPPDRPGVRALLAGPGGAGRLVRVVGFDGVEQPVVIHVGRPDEGGLDVWLVALGDPYGQAVRHGTNAQLADALGSRAAVDRAKGVLAAARGCTDEEAFSVLRAASQRRNVRLRAVAERVVEAAVPRRPGLAERIDAIVGAERGDESPTPAPGPDDLAD